MVFAKLIGMPMARTPHHRSMRLVVGLSTPALVLACSVAAAQPTTYRFDPVHTQVWFSAEHQGFSHPLGRLHVKQGWFQFDPDNWSASRVDVVIDLAGADMGDEKWNKAVRGGPLLDVEKWPTARFISSGVEKTSANAGVIHGELYFRGEQKPVDVDFTLNKIGKDPYAFSRKAGFSGHAEFSRSAFGMTRFAEVVGDRIELRFEIEGLPDSDAVKTAQDKDPP